MYDFGLYHWRRRFRTILSALAVILSAEVCRRTAESRWIRLVATAALLGGAVRGVSAARRLLSPPPGMDFTGVPAGEYEFTVSVVDGDAETTVSLEVAGN